MRRNRLRRSAAPVLGLVLLGAGVAAAHGGDGSDINACVHRASRHVRIVGENEGCRSEEQAIHWGIQGPEGPPGPQGPEGPQGPAGPPGADTQAFVVNGSERVELTTTPEVFAELELPPGSYIVHAKALATLTVPDNSGDSRPGTTWARCRLNVGDEWDSASASGELMPTFHDKQGGALSMLLAVESTSPVPARLTCDGAERTADDRELDAGWVTHVKVVAWSVGSVTDLTPEGL